MAISFLVIRDFFTLEYGIWCLLLGKTIQEPGSNPQILIPSLYPRFESGAWSAQVRWDLMNEEIYLVLSTNNLLSAIPYIQNHSIFDRKMPKQTTYIL